MEMKGPVLSAGSEKSGEAGSTRKGAILTSDGNQLLRGVGIRQIF